MRAFELEAFNPELYQTARRYAGHVIFSGALVALAIIGTAHSTIAIAAGQALFLACGLIAICLMAIAKWRGAEVKHDFPGGRIIAFDFDPHPINSLVKALQDHVPICSIETMKMMSSDIQKSDEYYNHGHAKEKSLVQIIREECPHATVTVYGPSEHQAPTFSGAHIKYVRTNGPLTKHTNLIVTKDGRSFVWYEPYHVIKGTRHIFTAGAYLIAIDDKQRNVVERSFDTLASEYSNADAVH